MRTEAYERPGPGGPVSGPRQHAAGDRQATRPGGRALRCAQCGHRVTREDQRTEVAGRHEHGFVNPHGYSFHIACFARAPGCRTIGSPTLEHTWFPGHAWQVALCARCGTHLGWAFHGPGQGHFFGLIVARLVSDE